MSANETNAKSAPEQSKTESGTTALNPGNSKKEPEKYYRLKKISGYLYQILEVSVDEDITPPKAVSKTDTRDLLMNKIEGLICDSLRKR